MKVIGTGAPDIVSIRFEACELDVLRSELCQVRALAIDGAYHAHHNGNGNGVADVVENRYAELLEVSRALDRLDRQLDVGEDDEVPIVMEGPSWFWAPVISSGAGTASERLFDALERYRESRYDCKPEELRAAAAGAGAWAETLLAYHYVDNHGLNDEDWS